MLYNTIGSRFVHLKTEFNIDGDIAGVSPLNTQYSDVFYSYTSIRYVFDYNTISKSEIFKIVVKQIVNYLRIVFYRNRKVR